VGGIVKGISNGFFKIMHNGAAGQKGLIVSRITDSQVRAAAAVYSSGVGSGLQSNVIMAPVLWAARRMAECRVGVRKGDDEPDYDHSMAQLLRFPNPYYTGSAMRMAMAIEFMMDGNAYQLKVRNKLRGPVELMFVPHWCMEPHAPSSGGYIDYYEYSPNGLMGLYGTFMVPAEDVIHVRNGVDPENVRKGLSSLKILLREIYTDEQASMFTAMLLKNNGVPGLILSPKDPTATLGGDPTETKAYIMEQFRGTRAGEPMVMKRATEVHYLGMEPSKLDLSALRDVPEERVTALLGIPAAVVGFGSGLQQTKVGATMAEMRAMAYEDCIIPMQNNFSDGWDLFLLPDFEPEPRGYRAVWDLSGVRVLQEDLNKKVDRLTRQLTAGAITLEKYHEALEMESAPDEAVYFIGMGTQLIPADALMEEATREPPPPVIPAPVPPEGEEGGEEPIDPGVEEIPVGDGKSMVKSFRLSRAASRFIRAMREGKRRAEGAWGREIHSRLEEYGKQLAAAFEAECRDRGLKADEILYDDVVDAVLRSVDVPDLEYAPRFLAIAKQVFHDLTVTMGVGVNLTDPIEYAILQAAGKRMGLMDLAGDARESLFDAIRMGRETGEGAAEIARMIRDLVPAGNYQNPLYRSRMVARTEVAYAQNRSSLEAYRSLGPELDAILVFDAQLGDTDQECMDLNGQTVTLEEADRLAETEHPNGTRNFAPVIGPRE
jgi:HK97 family phage portal protein